MTYDLQVFLYKSVSREQLDKILIPMNLERELFDATEDEFSVSSKVSGETIFLVNEVREQFRDYYEKEDSDKKKRIAIEFDIEGSHREQDSITGFGRRLIDFAGGTMFDPQIGKFTYSKIKIGPFSLPG